MIRNIREPNAGLVDNYRYQRLCPELVTADMCVEYNVNYIKNSSDVYITTGSAEIKDSTLKPSGWPNNFNYSDVYSTSALTATTFSGKAYKLETPSFNGTVFLSTQSSGFFGYPLMKSTDGVSWSSTGINLNSEVFAAPTLGFGVFVERQGFITGNVVRTTSVTNSSVRCVNHTNNSYIYRLPDLSFATYYFFNSTTSTSTQITGISDTGARFYFINNTYFYVNSSTNAVSSSTNGTTWTAVTRTGSVPPINYNYYHIPSYGTVGNMVLAGNGVTIYGSLNGISWFNLYTASGISADSQTFSLSFHGKEIATYCANTNGSYTVQIFNTPTTTQVSSSTQLTRVLVSTITASDHLMLGGSFGSALSYARSATITKSKDMVRLDNNASVAFWLKPVIISGNGYLQDNTKFHVVYRLGSDYKFATYSLNNTLIGTPTTLNFGTIVNTYPGIGRCFIVQDGTKIAITVVSQRASLYSSNSGSTFTLTSTSTNPWSENTPVLYQNDIIYSRSGSSLVYRNLSGSTFSSINLGSTIRTIFYISQTNKVYALVSEYSSGTESLFLKSVTPSSYAVNSLTLRTGISSFSVSLLEYSPSLNKLYVGISTYNGTDTTSGLCTVGMAIPSNEGFENRKYSNSSAIKHPYKAADSVYEVVYTPTSTPDNSFLFLSTQYPRLVVGSDTWYLNSRYIGNIADYSVPTFQSPLVYTGSYGIHYRELGSLNKSHFTVYGNSLFSYQLN